MSTAQGTQPAEIRFRKVDLPVGYCIERGWTIATASLLPFIGYTCVVIAVHAALACIPVLGWIAIALVGPALSAGYFVYTRKKIRGEPAVFEDFFGGFEFLGQLFLLGIVSDILIAAGILLCILPGLYLMLGYMFAGFLVVARRMDFWPAMEASRRAVTANIGPVILLVLAFIGINILGALACLVGLIITIPMTYCSSVVAFGIIFDDSPTDSGTAGPIQI